MESQHIVTDSAILWLRPHDSPPPVAISSTWKTYHLPITKAEPVAIAHVPDHQCLLFTSGRAPQFLASATTKRRPILCVGDNTRQVARNFGWSECLSIHENAKALQRHLSELRLPEPLLYAHGTPLSIPPAQLLSPCVVRHYHLCCYRHTLCNTNWPRIDRVLKTHRRLLVPLLSLTTAKAWRTNQGLTQSFSHKLKIDFFCLSLRVASGLEAPLAHETISIAKRPTLTSLLQDMNTHAVF